MSEMKAAFDPRLVSLRPPTLRLLARSIAGAGAILFLSGVATADDAAPYQVPDFIREAPALPDGIDPTKARQLTLRDAIQIAVEGNLGIVLKKEQLIVLHQGYRLSRGRFEPAVVASFQHSNALRPPLLLQTAGTAGVSSRSVGDAWAVGYRQELRTGATLAIGFTGMSSRLEGTGFDAATAFDAGASVELTQPLLRGFAFSLEIPYAEVLRARFASEQARQSALTTLSNTVTVVEDSYWDLVQSLKNYHVQKNSLALAREQLALTRRQIDAGVLSPSDLINAEGTLAQRELGLVQAETLVADAADQLRSVLNLPRQEWSQPILPVDAPQFEPVALAFDDAMKQAMENRPELKQNRLELERAALDVRVAKTNRLPELDATASYRLAGEGSTRASAQEQLQGGNFPAWSGQLNLTWTPANRSANAAVAAARASERLARAGLDQQLLELTVELHSVLRSLDATSRELLAASKFRDLAERSLDAEQRKFLNGTSSNFFIAQRQSDLAQARLAELAALIRNQKAATALRAATGTLLEARNVRLELREP